MLEAIREAVIRRPAELARARAQGQVVVGYFCCYMPEEILLALGLLPVRLGRGGDEELLELGARYVSTKTCAFIRESVGLFASGKDPFATNCDLVTVAGTCIQMYRLSEIVKHYFHPKTIALGVPRNYYLPEGRAYFRAELQDFIKRLENLSGQELDAPRLRASIQLCRDVRECQEKIYCHQAAGGNLITWQEVLEVIQAGFYLDRPTYLTLLRQMLAELENQAIDERIDRRPRIFLAGSIIAPGDGKIVGLIQEMGGRIVVDDLCTGQRFFRAVSVAAPTIDAIADAYLERIPCASLPCLLPMEEDRRFTEMMQLIEEYQVEGMVYHTLRFCDPFTFKANATKNFLQEQIPFLELHTEYSPSDVEAIRTRVESFIDLIYARRKRKQGG
jgi:benzoyl-CoA reductase/2-hydroxyglutaryl-CoA dehydratase subunit BcrC/BadD/HgdB